MKHLLLLFCIIGLFSTTATATAQSTEFNRDGNPPSDGDFGNGSDEFEFEKFSNENVLMMIENDMEMACNKVGLCTIHSVTSNDERFTTSFNFGQGNPNANLGGGGGTVILNGQDSTCADCANQLYWGVKLEFTRGQCTQSVKVPRSIYISMNRYMYDLMDDEGYTRRGFDPAKEAMIMFYSTIMKQATGCTAPK